MDEEEEDPFLRLLLPNKILGLRSNTSPISSATRSLSSPVDWINPRKRFSPVLSLHSPIPSHDDSTCTADDEVDSTSECTDSEYSVPLTKMPLLDTSGFSLIKIAMSDIENKHRELHSENVKLQKKLSDLEYEKDELKSAKKNLERNLQEERKMCNIVKAKQQNTERRLVSEQENAKTLETKLQEMENQLKREQSLKEQWKQKFEQVLQNVQNQLDACRQDNEPIKWFDGHDVSKLPQVNMMILMPHLPELTSIWEKLGVTLGVGKKVDIESTININTDLKCMHMLQFWMDRTPSSWPPFLNALTKLNRQQLALQIERELLDKIK